MATNVANDRPTLAPTVQTVLGALRHRIRQYVWLEGCATAVTWLGVAFWGTLAVDWFFEPSVVVRGILLAGVVIVLAGVLVQLIGRRAFVRITDSNAATILERRFPQLNDSLLTAVVLANREGSSAAAESLDDAVLTRQMLAHTCDEAAARIEGVDLKLVFNPRPLWRSGTAAGLLVLSIAFFAILSPDGLGVWARRTLAFSNELWPRSTRLEVVGFVDGVQKVARGSDLEVVARADAAMPQVPQVVEVRYRTDGGNRGRATMDRRGIAHGPEDQFQEYAYTFRSVLADIHFDVVGGDDRVADRWILVVDSPTISEMTLDCELPEYIGRKQSPLPVSGVMQVPMGSRVTIRAAAANKDLARVEVNSIIDDHALAAVVLDEGGLASDRRGFSYALEPLMKDMTLLFTLTDADGIRSRDPVRLMLVPLPDQPPQMTVQLDGIGTAVTSQARIPAVGRITDDYGIGRVWFEHAVDQEKQGERTIREFSDRPTEVKLTDAVLDVTELGVAPGQKLLVTVKTADLRDLGEGPNIASSERWLLDVVTPEQLRAMLDARELVLRQRFDRMIQEMTETRDLLARLDFAPPPAGEPGAAKEESSDDEPADSPARQHALRLLRVEGALTNCRKSTQEVLGVAEAFDDIRKQLVNNGIDTEELKNRLKEGIADPLRTVADPMLPELERRLEALRPVLDDTEKGPGVRERAQEQADEILLAMQKVRDRMIDLEGFNEAVDLLRGIIKMQDQLRDQTQQRQKQKIRELLKE